MPRADESTVDDPSVLSVNGEEDELEWRGKIEVLIQRGEGKYKKKDQKKKKKGEAGDAVLNMGKLMMHDETTKNVAMHQGKSHHAK